MNPDVRERLYAVGHKGLPNADIKSVNVEAVDWILQNVYATVGGAGDRQRWATESAVVLDQELLWSV